MKAEIPETFYAEIEYLTNLIETVGSAQDFKNPQQLATYVLTGMNECSHQEQTQESRVLH